MASFVEIYKHISPIKEPLKRIYNDSEHCPINGGKCYTGEAQHRSDTAEHSPNSIYSVDLHNKPTPLQSLNQTSKEDVVQEASIDKIVRWTPPCRND